MHEDALDNIRVFDDDFSKWHPQFGWWLQRRERVIEKLNLRQPKSHRVADGA